MQTILPILTVLGLLSLVPLGWQLRRAVAGTTLRLAWGWLVLLWGTWTGVCCATAWWPELPAGVREQLWYGVAVLGLCPPIAVLGAKRPMSRVWGWFIIAPLVLIFAWPAASAWGRRFLHAPWNLEEPVCVGYLVVLIMGLGNYLGTRLTLSTLLYGWGLLCLIVPLCPPLADRWFADSTARLCATGCLILAGWCGAGLSRRRPVPAAGPTASPHPFDRLWDDFRNHFGIVWAKRFQDRYNDLAQKNGWPAELTPAGFVPRDIAARPSVTTSPEIATQEATLRWLLRRYVDPEWIDARLENPSSRAATDSER